MKRACFLALLLAGRASAQSPAPADTTSRAPLYFRANVDVHRQSVRIRAATDPSAPWTMASAAHSDGSTYVVVTAKRVPLALSTAVPWTVEVSVPTAHSRTNHSLKGGLVGGLLGVGAVITYANTCGDSHTNGVPCGIVMGQAPSAFEVGAVLGAIVGSALPTHRWYRVEAMK